MSSALTAVLSSIRRCVAWVILLVFSFSGAIHAEPLSSQNADVVSLDYCADQFVLELLPRGRILALSPDASKYFSYHQRRAEGILQVSPRAEPVLALNPRIVVRSYGGGPNALRFFERLGIQVVQLGYSQTLSNIAENILSVGAQLDALPRANTLLADFERRLNQLRPTAPASAVSTLYTTPGGVTTGPGSLIHEAMLTAGLTNYQERRGWHPLPLEQLVTDKPELLAAGWFGDPEKAVDPWSLMRHPHVKALSTQVPSVELPGAWTSCGAWFLLDAVDAMAKAAQQLQANPTSSVRYASGAIADTKPNAQTDTESGSRIEPNQ